MVRFDERCTFFDKQGTYDQPSISSSNHNDIDNENENDHAITNDLTCWSMVGNNHEIYGASTWRPNAWRRNLCGSRCSNS